MFEAARDLARRRNAAPEVEREQDLTAGGVRDGGDDLLEGLELLMRVQAGSTSQMVSSSSTGPIGSQTAITSGV